MKTLYLNRHAKSSWEDGPSRDLDRPLNDRGLRDASLMGKRLLHRKDPIQLFVSSPAKRAISTARLMAEAMAVDPKKIVEKSEIYQASVPDLLKCINHLDDQIDSVILFGHNPGFTDLNDYLSGAGIFHIPTCGICKLEFALESWKEVSVHTGQLVFFDFPKKEENA